jgi:hypothetical protein
MATRIKGKTREQITTAIVDYLKNVQKEMGKTTNKEVRLDLSNWTCGMGNNRKWSFSEIHVGYDSYLIEDKEVTTTQFIQMLNNAIAKAEVRAKVFYKECGDGYWTPKQTIFEKVEIYAKPCDNFIKLQKLIEKYANYTLHETDIFDTRVCGKRSSWSDSGNPMYLCYDPDKCKKLIDLIKAKRTSRDNVNVEIKEYFSHGDDADYRCAIHMESEWYGYRGTKLILTITTPKGKVKAKQTLSMNVYENF